MLTIFLLSFLTPSAHAFGLSDCRGIVSSNYNLCRWSDCRGIVSGNYNLCGSGDCRGIVSGNYNLCR